MFGIGGVGGYCCEGLCRCGIGEIDLFDDDEISQSNLNRQIIALHSTQGLAKVDAMKSRLLDINPSCIVTAHNLFFSPEIAHTINFSKYDYVIDAVDTVTAKLCLVTICKEMGIPIISSMGTANKLDPTAVSITDIYKTDTCPLARVMRKQLRKRGIESLDVCYSTEKPITPVFYPPNEAPAQSQRQGSLGHKLTPGSVAFVPAAAGMALASFVVRKLLQQEK